MAQAQHKDSARQDPSKHDAPKPFQVTVDAARHGAFVELRDAMEAAQIVKRERPQAMVNVKDQSTGQVIAVD